MFGKRLIGRGLAGHGCGYTRKMPVDAGTCLLARRVAVKTTSPLKRYPRTSFSEIEKRCFAARDLGQIVWDEPCAGDIVPFRGVSGGRRG